MGDDRVICRGASRSPKPGPPELAAARAALLTAPVASKTSKPARFVDPADLDTRLPISGQSNFARYKVGFASNGQIESLMIDQFSDNAHAHELPEDVVLRGAAQCR